MKELSIEQKAKAYDEAFETARKINSGEGVEAPPGWTICEVIFPELRESEDEKTRKALISFLKSPFVNENITDEKVAPWIAWLEKQAKETSYKPSKEDDVRRRSTIQVLEYARSLDIYNQYGKADIDKNIAWLEKQGTSYTKRDVDDAYVEGMAFAKDELEKQGEQKSVVIIPKFRVGDEIITENEESLTITRIDKEGYWSNDLFICDFDSECVWDLVEQKPAWSEEDSKMRLKILTYLSTRCNVFEHEEIENWLNSFKQRLK